MDAQTWVVFIECLVVYVGAGIPITIYGTLDRWFPRSWKKDGWSRESRFVVGAMLYPLWGPIWLGLGLYHLGRLLLSTHVGVMRAARFIGRGLRDVYHRVRPPGVEVPEARVVRR